MRLPSLSSVVVALVLASPGAFAQPADNFGSVRREEVRADGPNGCAAEQRAAANTPKIKNIRVRELSTSVSGAPNPSADGRAWTLEVVTGGDVPANARLSFHRTRAAFHASRQLAHRSTHRRVSVPVFLGDTSVKGTKLELTLVGVDGKPAFRGTAYVAPGSKDGRWSGTYEGGKEPGFWTGSLAIFSTTQAGGFDVAFSIEGVRSEEIAGGTLTTETQSKEGLPTRSLTNLDSASFVTTRTFGTTVGFSGDPVGSRHEVFVTIEDGSSPASTTERSLIEMVQLPGEGTAPGPILGISAHGSGTRTTSSTTTQTQQTELL